MIGCLDAWCCCSMVRSWSIWWRKRVHFLHSFKLVCLRILSIITYNPILINSNINLKFPIHHPLISVPWVLSILQGWLCTFHFHSSALLFVIAHFLQDSFHIYLCHKCIYVQVSVHQAHFFKPYFMSPWADQCTLRSNKNLLGKILGEFRKIQISVELWAMIKYKKTFIGVC